MSEFPVVEISVSSALASAVLTALWLLNTYRRYRPLASPFHHFFSLLLAFRSTNLAAAALFHVIAIEEAKLYFALLEAVSYTLYNSFLFIALAVLSHGFMTLRHAFTREEFGRFTCWLGGFYFVFGVYRMNSETLNWLYLGIVLVTGTYCLWRTFESVRVAEQYLTQLQRHRLEEMSRSATQKLEMLTRFRAVAIVFFLNETIVPVMTRWIPDWMLYETITYNAIEFLCVALLAYIYRVRALDPFFGIVDFYDWPDEQEWRPVQVFQATTRTRAIEPGKEALPVLVELPCASRTFKFEHYEIGQLEEPLLTRST